jgi:uncharacterized protein YjbI with pentapeptide repeats
MIDAYPAIYASRLDLDEARRDPKHALWVCATRLKALPPEMKKFRRLRAIDVTEGSIKELPAWLGELSGLVCLRLDDNRLKTVPPEIAKLKRLKWLGLTKNALESLPPEIGDLAELDSLWLDQNPKLRSLPDALFSLKQLRRLDLTNTGIAELPEGISHLTSLKSITLDKTPLFKNRASREALKKRFKGATWSDGTLEIPRRRSKPVTQQYPRAQLLKLIHTEQLADRAVVEGADLSKATFTSIALKGQHFHNANLQGSRWTKCALSIGLVGANLQGAVFEDCLIEGDFEALTWNKVDARGAIFRRCTLENSGFERADLRGARVELAAVDYGPSFDRINGEGLVLVSHGAEGVSLEGANLRGAVLEGEFSSAACSRAVLVGADLTKATFPDAEFAKANLTDALLGPKTLAGAEVDEAKGVAVALKKPKPVAKPKKVVSRATGSVSSEGGPFMAADFDTFAPWGGADVREGERDSDYGKLLKRLRGSALVEGPWAFWQVDPGNHDITVNVAKTEVLIVNESGEDDTGEAAPVTSTTKGKAAGHVQVSSGRLAISWAVTSGKDVLKGAKKWPAGQAKAKLYMSNWAFGVTVKPGTYTVTTGSLDGRIWCRLSRE